MRQQKEIPIPVFVYSFEQAQVTSPHKKSRDDLVVVPMSYFVFFRILFASVTKSSKAF